MRNQYLRGFPLLQYDFEDSVGYWIATTNQAYMRTFQEHLAPLGITFRQAQVLAWLSSEGPMSQAELASRMLIEPPSLVGVIDRMEQSGLLERHACEQDRRKNRVHLLPAAEEVWKPIARVGRAVRRQAVAGLTKKESNELMRLLKKVKDNVAP